MTANHTLETHSARNANDIDMLNAAGLGVGWLPRWVAEREAWAGRLVILEPEAPRPPVEMVLAWRPSSAGKAAKWFVKRLEDPLVAASLMS